MFDYIPHWLLKPLLDLVQKSDWLSSKVNAYAINAIVNRSRHRPHPWSTFADYVCWTSLSDQHWSARHLPAAYLSGLPEPADIVPLFQRAEGGQKFSDKSTCLFPAFAQYLTDGFIRTVMPQVNQPYTLRRENTSNHQIDMSPLYGRNALQIAALRLSSQISGQRGRLKSQVIAGEEYSPFLYDASGAPIPPFDCLDPPLGQNNITNPVQRQMIFAAGGDRVNSAPQIAMMNTLFLREHNRLAGKLEALNPAWDDERVFQTARNIIIVLFIKIVVEEYINHIAPIPFRIRADPSVAWNAPWNKPNWITTEFSLLYRWHSLVPDEITWGGTSYPVGTTFLNNEPLLRTGLLQSFIDMSAQRSAKLGAFNTAQALLSFEFNALKQGRVCNVAPYVDYRKYVGLSVPERFEDISKNPEVVAMLQNVYEGDVGKVDFYAGLFAEDTVPNSPLPELILTMVAIDAFSQALTNPLLSEHVYNAETFSQFGWDTIAATTSLRDIVLRNCSSTTAGLISMTQPQWQYH